MANSTLMLGPPERHYGYICISCNAADFPGRRYSCWICLDYHLCGPCYDANYTPHSPHHRYYHPLDVHFTLGEFQLYFGGEPYLPQNIPQSYKCAICYEHGYANVDELYFHLNTFHYEHVDYEDYSGILIRRRAVEASVSDMLIPPRGGGGGGGGGEAEVENAFQFSIVDVTEQPQMIQEVPPEVPPLMVGTSSSEDSARSQPSDLYTSDRDVPLFYLEIVPIALDTEHQYKHLGKQAVKLIEELDLFRPGEPEYIKRSLHILMKARGLRRQLQKLPLDRQSTIGNQAASTESFLSIIEHEVTENFARQRQFQNRQQNQESTPNRRPAAPSAAALCRRGGLAPGSLAASAATTLAVAAASEAATNDINIGGPIRRNLNSLLHLPPVEPFHHPAGVRHLRRSNAAAAFRGLPPPPPPISMPRRNRDNTNNRLMVTLDQLFPTAGLRPSTVALINNMPPLRNIRQVAPRPKPEPRKPPPRFMNLVNEIVGKRQTRTSTNTKSKDKPLEPIEDDHLPSKNQYSFLCAKLKPENRNPSGLMKLSNQGNFIEAILCSMLADAKLSQLSHGIKPIDNNLTNISTSDKSLFKPEVNAQSLTNSPDMKTDFMYRFYSALNNYKKWQTDFQDQLATENIEPAAAALNPAGAMENAPARPHNGMNIQLPPININQSAHELDIPPIFIYDSGDEVENDNEDGDELQDDSNIDQSNESSVLNNSLNESIDVEDEEGAEGEEETNESTGEAEWEDYEDNESETDLSDNDMVVPAFSF
ncbi:uncharacterized protein LOC26528852 [Drosophila willistoni]|uniref:uncharacterized protein LOC26528852 n=1 Tax=Drosophila willistoni TaxID=7260 RepID=UPI001F07F30E|nr:uncharacterized protein LOC26528852 [Drosophila willistoni]